jgi:heme/copper-type cytochrome/quinol oxidase subunit 3
MSQINERKGIVSGIFLLIGLHIAAVILGIIVLLIHFL